MSKWLLALPLLVQLAGCASGGSGAAKPDASIGAGPDAPGFIIIGYADETAENELFHVYQSLALGLRSAAGQVVNTARYGCRVMLAANLSDSCDTQNRMRQLVLQVPPGTWRLMAAAETVRTGFPVRNQTMTARLPPGVEVPVGPGEIVYMGDFLFRFDNDSSEVLLKSHSRDDAGAARALEPFPGLRGRPIVFRDPTPRS